MSMKVKWVARKIAAKMACFFDRQKEFVEIHELIETKCLIIGRHTYGTPKVWVYQGSECKIIIGSFCSIAPGVQIIAGGIHPTNWVSTYPFRIMWQMPEAYRDGMPETRGDIVIGSDVWLGTDATVLSGVSIGHGAVLAARSVVTHSVPPYAVVAGCTARVIKYRFEASVVDRLLKIAWWDWNEDKIREAVPLLSNSNVDLFLRQYEATTE